VKPPPVAAEIVPAELLPSPQVIVALKSAAVAPGFASEKLSASCDAVTPSTPSSTVGVPLESGASATCASPCPTAVLPPSPATVAVTWNVPSSA
jgi:hypothetical protein